MGMMQSDQGYNPTTAHGKYNGTVDVQGQPVQVEAGIANVEGQPYFVSDDGKLVLNAKGQLTGHIQDGKFEVVTEAYARKMRELGYA